MRRKKNLCTLCCIGNQWWLFILSALSIHSSIHPQKFPTEKSNIHISPINVDPCFVILVLISNSIPYSHYYWTKDQISWILPILNLVQCHWRDLKRNSKCKHNTIIIIIRGIALQFFSCLIIPRWELCPHFMAVFQFICMSWYYEGRGRVKLKSHV